MMKAMWMRGKKIASAMGVTPVYQCLHLISLTSSRVGVLDHPSHPVVMKLLISRMIHITLMVDPEVLFCLLALLIQGNYR
jgi:hypothetical protein